MRSTVLGLLLTFFCISCQQKIADKEIKTNTEQSSNKDRNALIAELRRLQSACAKNDKEKIAAFFAFPVADTSLGIYFGDEPVTVTREVFFKEFSTIKEQTNFSELSEILKHLNVDSLKYVNELEYNSKTDVQVDSVNCISGSDVRISGDTVRLSWYLNGFAEPDKAPEEGFPACEYGSYWEFLFNGKKLIFVRHMAAG